MLAKLLIWDELVWNRVKVEVGKYPIQRRIGLERTKLSVIRVIQQKVELVGFSNHQKPCGPMIMHKIMR